MAFNGAGLFLRLFDWTTDAANAIKIRADRMDDEMDGMATGLSTCLLKDGQQTATADQPMGGFKHTGVATAVTARTHYTPVAVFQDGGPVFVDGGGTADAITATYAPSITALVDGMELRVRATAANATTTPTFAPNGLTARTITKNGLAALVAGDIAGDGHELILRYHATGTGWELLNPGGTVAIAKGGTGSTTASAARTALAVPGLADANTFAADQTIQSTDAGASSGPFLNLDRFSASPAASDLIGGVKLQGRDAGGNLTSFATIYGTILDPTDLSEDGQINFETLVAGSPAQAAKIAQGIQVGTPTGGDKGAGTLNATGLYQAGVLVADRVVQVVNTQTGAVATTTTVMPNDDTIPQITEGGEFMTLAITPTNANSKLKIEVIAHVESVSVAGAGLALFQDATANALAATRKGESDASSSDELPLTLTHYMTAGTTSATTFRVRAGPLAASTLTFNGVAGARKFGGVMASSITITEIRA